jgi:uncharacterized protein YbjT (DUF2867 family)
MRITVLGATGRTGRHIVADALRRGHPITQRSPVVPTRSPTFRDSARS